MFRGARTLRVLAAALVLFSAGCAVLPLKSSADLEAPVAQRDMLADAAFAVERAPWPKPEKVSLMARITGGSETVTQDQAIDAYLSDLRYRGMRFATLEIDARANLRAARAFNLAAIDAMDAPLLSMNDVALVEGAINSLREHRDIYVAAAKEIADSGDVVDDDALDALRRDYRDAMRILGDTADKLADRIANDHRSNYASPDRDHGAKYFSDL